MQARHHRADRHSRNLRDLAVIELMQLVQHDRLAQRLRECFDQTVQMQQV